MKEVKIIKHFLLFFSIFFSFCQVSKFIILFILDRRPIDPPPIVQIRLNNATPQQTEYVVLHQNQSKYIFKYLSGFNFIIVPSIKTLTFLCARI